MPDKFAESNSSGEVGRHVCNLSNAFKLGEESTDVFIRNGDDAPNAFLARTPPQPIPLRRALSADELAMLPPHFVPPCMAMGDKMAAVNPEKDFCETQGEIGEASPTKSDIRVTAVDRAGSSDEILRDSLVSCSLASTKNEGNSSEQGQLTELWNLLPRDVQTKVCTSSPSNICCRFTSPFYLIFFSVKGVAVLALRLTLAVSRPCCYRLVLQIVTEMLPGRDMQAWRLADKQWASTVSNAVTTLRPSPRTGLPLSGAQLATIFPRLDTLDLFHVAIDISCRAPLQLHISQRYAHRSLTPLTCPSNQTYHRPF
jgi:hypothetical protein